MAYVLKIASALCTVLLLLLASSGNAQNCELYDSEIIERLFIAALRLSAKCYLCYRNFHRNLPLKLSWFVRRYCLAHNYTVIICQVDFELDTLCLLVTEVNISELSLCFILTSGPSHFRSHWVVVLLTYQQ